MRALALSALILIAANAAAETGIPWFDLQRLPDPVRSDLVRHRALACGAVGPAELPLPEGVQLVFVSCHGGPYCASATDGLGAYERQFTCPPDPTSRQIATMHLVSRLPLARLSAFYREALGPEFLGLGATDGGTPITFVESAAVQVTKPWSPKRLHLALSATREPFAGEGYPSQIRVTLSISPPTEPRPVVRCHDDDLLARDGSRLSRLESRYCWW